MPTDSLSIASWQFRMVWRLADEVHLPRLTDALCLWRPHPASWTVHRAPDGRWLPDWADEDPPEPAPPSVAWLTWHLIAALSGGKHESVTLPLAAGVRWRRS